MMQQLQCIVVMGKSVVICLSSDKGVDLNLLTTRGLGIVSHFSVWGVMYLWKWLSIDWELATLHEITDPPYNYRGLCAGILCKISVFHIETGDASRCYLQ